MKMESTDDGLRVTGAPNLSGFSMMSLALSPSMSKGAPLGANKADVGRVMGLIRSLI